MTTKATGRPSGFYLRDGPHIPSYFVDVQGCWIWTRFTDRDGYARQGRKGEPCFVHRANYEAFNGTIPAGMTIDHLCRVRSCVNPDHMEAVTHKENVQRGESFSVENASKTRCVHGHSLSGDNLKIETHRGQRRRVCWKCRQEVSRRTWQRTKARAAVEKLESKTK